MNKILDLKEDNELQIKVTLGTNDILYCALVFCDPVYAILIKIPHLIGDVFANKLIESDCCEIKHLSNFYCFIFDGSFFFM